MAKKTSKKTSASRKKANTPISLLKRIGKYLLKCLIWFIILTVAWVVLLRFVPVYYTPLMFIRLGEQIKTGKTIKMEHDWVSIDEINPNMVNAVIASEDNLFLKHNGFDLNGIVKAYENNQKRKKMRGGSTISQQTAKNTFLFPSRTWLRKGLETYFTVLIELCWTKERIMEVYLNVIETGDGIYGVEAAAQHYFNKSAAKLTKSEAALLAVTLPNPRKFSASKPSSYTKKRQTKILRLMNLIGNQKFDK
ncbi:MAG: monofunctional biosynthetic peptidoglycan transglycosylase [Prevotellaceae bacterium]|jgi:monofunctional biosynthetic peptidoglycan transglycosylase|nr:monofunctional biosynthetic peptidoglycan transglycosylase [Prevotellaceae bacterium]